MTIVSLIFMGEILKDVMKYNVCGLLHLLSPRYCRSSCFRDCYITANSSQHYNHCYPWNSLFHQKTVLPVHACISDSTFVHCTGGGLHLQVNSLMI